MTTSTSEGTRSRNASSSSWWTDRAGRVVRGADEHEAGPLGDRGEHRLEVVAGVGVQRHLDRRRAGDGHHDRVGLERAPRVDDLVARVAGGLDDLAEHAHAAGAGGQVLDRHVQALGEGLAEGADGHVGVPVHLGRGVLHDLQHAGQRRVRVLVAADLVRRRPLTRGRGLARLVRGDLAQRIAQVDLVTHTGTVLRPGVPPPRGARSPRHVRRSRRSGQPAVSPMTP